MEPIKYSYLPEQYTRPFKINHVHFLDDGTLEDLFTKERGSVLLPEFLITHYNEGGESNNYIDYLILKRILSLINNPYSTLKDKPLGLSSPEFDLLALGVPLLFIRSSLPLMKKGVLELGNYTKNVGERITEMRLKPVLPSREYLLSKGFIKRSKGDISGNEVYTLPTHKVIDNGMYITESGGPVVIPELPTTEVHLNPPRSYVPMIPGYTDGAGMIGFSEKMPHLKSLYSVIQDMPVGTTIGSSSEAIAPIVGKIEWSFPLKLNYVITGRTPILDKELISGYSPDVFPLMESLTKRGDWVIRPSLNTEMKGTNVFTSKNIDLSPYTTNKVGTLLRKDGYQGVLPTMDAEIRFDKFNADLIISWNKDIAPKTGIYINPETKTAKHYLITKIR